MLAQASGGHESVKDALLTSRRLQSSTSTQYMHNQQSLTACAVYTTEDGVPQTIVDTKEHHLQQVSGYFQPTRSLLRGTRELLQNMPADS